MTFPVVQQANDALGMALYQQDRVFNDFNELVKIKPAESITVDDLLALDQMHYLGTETLDEAARVLNIGPGVSVVDVGAGYGGPARYLASRYGCQVTCLERQKHIHDVAHYFTRLVGLENSVRHIHVDLLAPDLSAAKYDHLLCLLVILHIAEKSKALQQIAGLLKENGKIYIEDYYEKTPLTAKERGDLQRIVSCPSLFTKEEYLDALQQAGFKNIRFIDMNEQWLPFVQERNRQFHKTQERQIRVHGKQLADELSVFYSTIVDLFGAGHLGGVRIVAEGR